MFDICIYIYLFNFDIYIYIWNVYINISLYFNIYIHGYISFDCGTSYWKTSTSIMELKRDLNAAHFLASAMIRKFTTLAPSCALWLQRYANASGSGKADCTMVCVWYIYIYIYTCMCSSFREHHLFGCEKRFYPTSVCRGLQKRSVSFIIYFLVLKNAYWGDNLKKRPMSTSSHFWAVIPPAIPNLVI